jgi:O-antigen/teichoic acid export membrane protein
MSSSLAKKTVSSAAWTYLTYGLSKATTFVTTAVLARLLLPEQFGVVGFALTVMSFLDAVRDLGLGPALIQRREEVDKAADTAFWLNIMSNILMWTAAMAISPFAARFFHEPLIIIILPVLSFSFVVSSVGGTHDALLQREMAFSRRIIPAVGESIVKGVVSIAIALTGGNVWALIIGQITGRTAYAALAWAILPWRPQFLFELGVAKELLGYGYKIAIDSLLSALQANIDYLFIGRFLGDTALGLYTIAFRVPEMIIINLCIVIAQVLFPAYSKLQNDLSALQSGLLAAIRYIALITVPAGIGLALVSPLFMPVIFGPEWVEAAPIMASLAMYGMFLAISWNIGDVYKAIGRPDILWKTALVEFALLAPVLFTLSHVSALAVSVGHMVVALIISMLRLGIAVQLLKLSVKKTLAQFVPAISGSAFMGLVVWGSIQITHEWSAALALLASIAVGAISYFSTMVWFERSLLLRFASLLRKRLSRQLT